MEDAKKREIRTIDCQLAIREAAEGQEGESRTITGRAIVFNAESEVLDDWGERFREVILPEAVTMEFLNTQDVKMNMLHERELTIARCNKGVGSLRMAVDAQGVTFEFEAPRCDIGDRCLEMVRRGDYSGCSFEFYPKDYEVERTKGQDGKDDVIIRHKSFEFLSALTIGMDPAYKQTSVNVREMCGKQPDKTDEELKREQQQREQDEREKELRVMRAYERRSRELQIASFRMKSNY
jgi:HK97 family phage prohead protease